MSNFYWVGIRESDLLATSSLYKGSVTFFGSGQGGNVCLFNEATPRKDHNEDLSDFNQFYEREIRDILGNDPDARFMFYNQSMAQTLDTQLKGKGICVNRKDILNILNHKMLCKLWLKNQVTLTPNIQIFGSEISFPTLQKIFYGSDAFVIQQDFSSGGHSTYIFNSENEKNILNKIELTRLYLVTPYFKNAIPLNFHGVIYNDGFQLYPPSVQIVQMENDQLIYKGGDFVAVKSLPDNILMSAKIYAQDICEKLRGIGYLGVCGIDFIVAEDTVYFMEINPRFQASTSIINLALQNIGAVSINQACIDAFAGKCTPNNLMPVDVPYSFFTYLSNGMDIRFFRHIWEKYFSTYPDLSVLSDGYYPGISAKTNAYLFRAIFPENLISLHPNEIRLAEVLTGYPINDNLSPIQLKTMLINFGLTINKDALELISQKGDLREANFSAIDITMANGLVINCPYHVGLSEYSPFEIRTEKERLALYFFDSEISQIKVFYESQLNKKTTRSGVHYSSVAFLATDRLRINYNPVCYYKSRGSGCTFCNLPDKNQAYVQDDIREILEDYIDHEEFRHILIGGGSGHPDSQFLDIIQLVHYLKTKTNKPLYLMSLPPREISCVKALCQAGVSEIAFNIEIFDRTLAARYMPGKGKIPVERYYSALSEAVKCLGNTGNVRSMLIIGFDPPEKLLEGIKALCEMGVQPMLSVFRPLEGTALERWMPPKTDELLDVFERSAEICRQHGLYLGPSCVFCQNNTLALPASMYPVNRPELPFYK